LGVVISKTARNITQETAFDYVGGYTIALDMTARDIQDTLKKAGNPWYLSKSFDTSCPVGEFIDKSRVPDPHNLEIFCTGFLQHTLVL
jgi:acylpyruvate hydrolase